MEKIGLTSPALITSNHIYTNVPLIRAAIGYGAMTDDEIKIHSAEKYGVNISEIFILRGQIGKGLQGGGKKVFNVALPVVLVEKIGKGSQGVVYCVRGLIGDHLMAVKIIKKQLGIPEIDDFLNSITHLPLANGMAIYRGSGELDGKSIEAADYVEGDSLESIFNNPSEYPHVGLSERLKIVFKVIKILIQCAEKNICPNDNKPANIIINNDGQVAFIDHGLSTNFEGAMALKKAYQVVGTPHYKAPEEFCEIDPEMSIDDFKKGKMACWSYFVGILLAQILGLRLTLNDFYDLFLTEETYEDFANRLFLNLDSGDEIMVSVPPKNTILKNTELQDAAINLVQSLIRLCPQERVTLEVAAEKIESLIEVG